jgi:hypothetical protein
LYGLLKRDLQRDPVCFQRAEVIPRDKDFLGENCHVYPHDREGPLSAAERS